jgi:copper(I)-binding protein
MINKIILKAFLIVLFPLSLFAQGMESSAKLNDIVINNIWARPTMGEVYNTAVYMDIKNNSSAHDILTKATTDVTDKVEIHKTVHENGVSKMLSVDKLSIPANAEINLVPGGIHIMLFKVKYPLKPGNKINLTLEFEKSGTLTIEVPVISKKKK